MNGGRLEYKFLVPNAHLDEFRDAVLPYMENDPYGESPGSSEYTVRSIYYDTPRFACYLEKLDGLEVRQKYRIRGYGRPHEKSLVFLEIKMKRGSMVGKHRAPLLHTRLDAFLAAPDLDRDIVTTRQIRHAREGARRFMYYYYRYCLRPTVLVAYDREAYFGRFDPSLRITFDKKVRGAPYPALADLYREDGLQVAVPGHFVLEIKFFRGALPVWVSSLIRRYGLKRMSVSKYTICMDAGKVRRRCFQVRRQIADAVLSA